MCVCEKTPVGSLSFVHRNILTRIKYMQYFKYAQSRFRLAEMKILVKTFHTFSDVNLSKHQTHLTKCVFFLHKIFKFVGI